MRPSVTLCTEAHRVGSVLLRSRRAVEEGRTSLLPTKDAMIEGS